LEGRDPAHLWQFYIQLVEVEAAFKNLKDDLGLRPIYHQLEERIEAHIFVAFMAYCLHATLRARLRPLAPGLTPRAVLDKLAAIQMLDVQFPTTDGRTLILTRCTEPNADQKLLHSGSEWEAAAFSCRGRGRRDAESWHGFLRRDDVDTPSCAPWSRTAFPSSEER
jgi:hypothetical protein